MCDPMESPCWSRLLTPPADLWRQRSTRWSRFTGRTYDPVGDPHWSSLFLKDCTQWKGLMLEQLVENCVLSVEPHTGVGEECEESSH